MANIINRNLAQPTETLAISKGSTVTAVVEKPKRKSATVTYHLKERLGSVFSAKTANDTLAEAKKQPDPRKLWKEFWFENEVCCLFADTNVGKSVLAVQIATEIAKKERVLYYDFEQSEKQFQMRYTDPESGKLFKFPNNLIRLTLSTDNLPIMESKLEDIIMASIEGDVDKYKSTKVIVDNISWLANATNSTKTASNLMQKLVDLKKRCGLSILVLAHTNKRKATRPIDQNDLAGSKKLINFFDAAFAIGASMTEEGVKYVKQIKVRTGKFTYDANNVLLCTIEQKNAFLQFVEEGRGNEIDHLQVPKKKDTDMKKAMLIELVAKGETSLRKIGGIIGVGKSTVGRWIDELGLREKLPKV